MVIYLGILSPICSSDLPESRRAALCFLFGLASNGVYMCPACYQPGGSLLHCLSTLTALLRRFISVALSLESPPPDVIWHPALWSPDFPLPWPFGFMAATICLTQSTGIIPYFFQLVQTGPNFNNITCNSSDMQNCHKFDHGSLLTMEKLCSSFYKADAQHQ